MTEKPPQHFLRTIACPGSQRFSEQGDLPAPLLHDEYDRADAENLFAFTHEYLSLCQP